jgi:hypothetical protein
MQEIVIKFRNPDNGRYYHLCLYQDLLGDFILSRYRGGLKRNHASHSLVTNIEETVKEIVSFIKVRMKHGYNLQKR